MRTRAGRPHLPRGWSSRSACAISGGLSSAACNDGVGGLVPVDLFIPGCPPHPITILDGLLRLLGRMPSPGAPTVQGASRSIL
jgi:NADH:ubiquinone oxidoreductase subunit B-like Fe-S oxidoreductase